MTCATLNLFAQAGPAAGVDPLSLIGSGSIAAVAIAAVMWLIRYYTGEIKEIVGKFEDAIREKDRQLLEQGDKFDATIKEVAGDFRGMVKEMRDEHKLMVDQQFHMARELVQAVEHVNAGLSETKQAMQALTGRVEAMDKRGRTKETQ